MKKIIFALLLFSVTTTFGQKKNAALVSVCTYKPSVTYYGLRNSPNMDAPTYYFANGTTFNDTIIFKDLKAKVAEILPQMNFQLMPEGSVLSNPTYKALCKYNNNGKIATEISDKGYAATSFTGLGGINGIKDYFVNETVPDVIVFAYANFDLNRANGTKFGEYDKIFSNLECTVSIKAYNAKSKIVFKYKTSYRNPKNVIVKQSSRSGWGAEINEDISQLQFETLAQALKQVNDNITEQIEKVNKFYKR